LDLNSFDANYPDSTFDAQINGTQVPGTDCLPALALRGEKREPPLVHQDSPVIPELKVISQPPLVQLADILTYAYEDEVIGNARVYIVDGGADVSIQVR
jgi:hypothetical protein